MDALLCSRRWFRLGRMCVLVWLLQGMWAYADTGERGETESEVPPLVFADESGDDEATESWADWIESYISYIEEQGWHKSWAPYVAGFMLFVSIQMDLRRDQFEFVRRLNYRKPIANTE